MEAEAARDEKQRRGAGGGAGGEGGSTRPPRALEQVKANRVSNVELDRPGAALKLSDTTTAAKAEPSSSHLAPPHRGRRPGEAGARRYVEREKRRATWRAVALLGVALPLLHGAESVAMRCYQGVSYSRVATDPVNPTIMVPKPDAPEKPLDQYFEDELFSPGVPETDCNDTKTNIYTSCYAVCQTMQYQNASATDVLKEVFEIHVCKYGCATEVQVNAMKRWKGGAMQLDFLCDCRWDSSSTFWTDTNTDFKGPVFCCPNCHLKLPNSPARCADEFSLTLKPCEKEGALCNLSPGPLARGVPSLHMMLGLAASALLANMMVA